MQVDMRGERQFIDMDAREIEAMLDRHRRVIESSARYRAYLLEAAERSKVITDRAFRELRAGIARQR